MIDQKLESDIKSVREFLEFWGKFHSFYKETVARELITKEDEEKFIETKHLVKNKYAEMRNSLEFRYMPHARMTDPVSDVLGTNGIRFVSEKHFRKLEDDWQDSFIFLNSILERLENNRRRLEQFNPVGVFFKRIFDRR